MSGHRPFRTLAEQVVATPEGRERVETYRRLMDAAITLHRLREERGLTQVQVAEALDVTRQAVHKKYASRVAAAGVETRRRSG